MESSTRFRFRDSTDLESASDDSSSVSSIGEEDAKIESLTAKGIKRLCSELIELKEASDEDFHATVYLNYPAFVRMFEQVGGIENEIIQLRKHVQTQRMLVNDLVDNTYLQMLSEESRDSLIEESLDGGQSPQDSLDAHMDEVSETLDILLSEHRLDEALVILELEESALKTIHLEENSMPRYLTVCNSIISEMKSKLAYKFAQVADHPKVPAPEFQKALSGLCRLGDSQCATQLLLKFYRLRVENGVHDLQSTKPNMHRTYIRDLAKFVFSTISQAARSFVLLYGENSQYASELIQWAIAETEVFACHLHKYVKSITEVNGGLSAAVEAVEYAISFCSILETQRIVLRPSLAKLIRPHMEDALKMHIDHYKKVIGVFMATDDWVLDKYPISGILKEEASPDMVGHRIEYCLLTNSGRKLVTFLQDTMNELSPLAVLQMETSILNGLLQLFTEYVNNLERAMPTKEHGLNVTGPRILLAQTLSQQLSILANASALVYIVSTTARSIFKGFKNLGSQLITSAVLESFQKELDSLMFSVEDMPTGLRKYFHQHTIDRVTSFEEGTIFSAENYYADQGGSDACNDLMPSIAFQVLFLELRRVEKVGKDILIEVDWLVELLRELMEAFLVWLGTNQEFWVAIDENLNFEHIDGFMQFVLDMHFLVEVTRFGGYCSSNLVDASLALISRMESAFVFAGGDPYRDLLADEWAISAAVEAIQKLLTTEKPESQQNDEHVVSLREDPNTHSVAGGSDSMEDAISFLEGSPQLDDGTTINLEDTANEQPVYNPYEDETLDDEGADICPTDWLVQSEKGTEVASVDNGAIGLLQETEEVEEPAMGCLVDVIAETSDQDEDEMVRVEADIRSSSSDSTLITNELVRDVEDGKESLMAAEMCDTISENSEEVKDEGNNPHQQEKADVLPDKPELLIEINKENLQLQSDSLK